MCQVRQVYQSLPSHVNMDMYQSLPNNVTMLKYQSLPSHVKMDMYQSLPNNVTMVKYQSLPTAVTMVKYQSLPTAVTMVKYQSLPNNVTMVKYQSLPTALTMLKYQSLPTVVTMVKYQSLPSVPIPFPEWNSLPFPDLMAHIPYQFYMKLCEIFLLTENISKYWIREDIYFYNNLVLSVIKYPPFCFWIELYFPHLRKHEIPYNFLTFWSISQSFLTVSHFLTFSRPYKI